MNYKFAKITIISLLFFLSFGGLVSAEESCSVLYNKQSDLINKYDTNQDKKLSLEESYQAVAVWNNYTISDAVLLDILKFSRQNCAIPTTDNDPVSGTLAISSTQVYVGDDITLTITGKDNNGLYALWTYYQGEWHKKTAQGTSDSATFTFSEKQAGIYIYFGYVYGKIPNGNWEFNWTEPKMVTVTVLDKQIEGPDLAISSVITDPSSLTTADEVDFKVTIKNIGTQAMTSVSGGIITRVSSSALPSPGYRICDAMTISLGSGESAVVDCPIVQKLSKGNHDFTFFVDSSNKLAEGNENNNMFSKTVSVLSTSGGNEDPVYGILSVNDSSVKTKEQFTLKVTAQDNQGVDKIKIYYSGAWHTFDCAKETSCTISQELSESISGTYTYYAKVYGFKADGSSENRDSSPSLIRVIVSKIGNCTETDGGKDYYTKGTTMNVVTDGGTSLASWTDICLKDNQTALSGQENYLFEAYCDDSGIGRLMSGPTVYVCSKGCQNGACIK